MKTLLFILLFSATLYCQDSLKVDSVLIKLKSDRETIIKKLKQLEYDKAFYEGMLKYNEILIQAREEEIKQQK